MYPRSRTDRVNKCVLRSFLSATEKQSIKIVSITFATCLGKRVPRGRWNWAYTEKKAIFHGSIFNFKRVARLKVKEHWQGHTVSIVRRASYTCLGYCADALRTNLVTINILLIWKGKETKKICSHLLTLPELVCMLGRGVIPFMEIGGAMMLLRNSRHMFPFTIEDKRR